MVLRVKGAIGKKENVKLGDFSAGSGVKSGPGTSAVAAAAACVLHLLGICCVPVDGLQDERPAQVHFEGNKQNSEIISPHRVPHGEPPRASPGAQSV